MQMYLWRSPFRNVSSGSDAAVLYHEYTHGLSNRLVIDADGIGALNTAQAGAMGEGWSDWYAQDFLVGQFPALDTGDGGRGRHGRVRQRALAAAVLADRLPGRGAARSPARGAVRPAPAATPTATSGASWGRPRSTPTARSGRRTLWDLRGARGLGQGAGAGDGGDAAAAARAVLPRRAQRHPAGRPGAVRRRRRGARCGACSPRAGWGSSRPSLGGEDTAPAEDFALPPGPDGAAGHDLRARHDRSGGAPVAGVTIGLGGVSGFTRDDRRRRALHDRAACPRGPT